MNRRLFQCFLAALLCVCAAAGGCAKKVERNPELEAAVAGYCKAVSTAYLALDLRPMEGYAAAKEIGRIRMIIMKFEGEKRFMESELKDIKFTRIDVKGSDKAIVETSEQWRFRHISRETGNVVLSWKEQENKIRYEMLKKDGRWLVEKTDFI